MTFPTPTEINANLFIPSHNASSPVKSGEAKFIYDFLKTHTLTKTLEVGLAYAKSASHIIAATQSPHIAIDPFQNDYKNIGLKNLKTLGLESFLNLYPDYAHNALPKILNENGRGSLEFAFIDGDHKLDCIFVDFYYADLLLSQRGYILFHDTWMRSTQLILSFIQSNRPDYELVKGTPKNLALIQKVGTDKRDRMHFKEFYSLKSLLRYRPILWLTNGVDSGLKRAMYRIRNAVVSNGENGGTKG